jgi:hypothetical protein
MGVHEFSRPKQSTTRWVGFALLAGLLAHCSTDGTHVERLSCSSAPLNNLPTLQEFVIYVERSISVGDFTSVTNGDLNLM